MSVLAPKQKQNKSSVKPKKKGQAKAKTLKGRSQVSQKQNVLGNRFMEQEAKSKEKSEKQSRAEKQSKQEEVSKKSDLPQEKAGTEKVLQEETAQEKVSKEEDTQISLQGDAVEAIGVFADASASDIAQVYPTLGETLSQKLKQEQEKESENAPVLAVKSDLESKVGQESKKKALLPKQSDKIDTSSEKEPPEPIAKEEVEKSKQPSNEGVKKILTQKPKEGFLSWFKNSFVNFLSQIKTRDVQVNTSVGKVAPVQLKGKANVSRMSKDKASSSGEIVTGKNLLTEKILSNPGQANIKAVKIDEKKPVQLGKGNEGKISTPVNRDMQEYLAIALSDDIRKHADALLKPSIVKSMKRLKENSTKIKQEKEKNKQRGINKSKEEVNRVKVKADKEQIKQINDGRQKVVLEQKKGLDDAHKSVDTFHKEIQTKEHKNKKEIDAKVKKANDDAHETVKKGDEKAKEIKKQKEKEAAQKKRELEKKGENKSFWSKAVSVVKSVVKVLTDAIDSIFTALRAAVKKVIEKAKNMAISLINKARKWVIKALDVFSTLLKSMVNKYLKDYFPRLAKLINKAIDTLVVLSKKLINRLADNLIKVVEAVANVLGKVLDKILSVYQSVLKAAVGMAGAALTGDFVGVLKIAIQAACDIAGIDSTPVFDFFKRAGKQFLKILKSPVSFFKNLVRAFANGIKGFWKNIKKHLKAALIGWLTGALADTEIELPEKFDFKGILSLAMQILGLTYKNIKARIIKKYPASEKVFDKVEKGFTLIKEILLGGMGVLWKKVKEKIGDLKEMVLTGIKTFVLFSVIKNGIVWLLSLLNPASAIAKVLKMVFDFAMFLVERFNQIKDFVLSVYHSITAIAVGSLAKASKVIEGALAKSLPVVISLLATVLGLGGIGKTIQKIIKKVSAPINKVIDKVVDNAVKYAKKLLGKFKGKKNKKDQTDEGKEKKANEQKKNKKLTIDKTLGKKLTFSGGKEEHKLWITNVGGKITVMVKSDVLPVEKQLELLASLIWKLNADQQAKAKNIILKAKNLNNQVIVEALQEKMITQAALIDKMLTAKEVKAEQQAEDETVAKEKQLEQVFKELFDTFGGIETGTVFDIVLRNRTIHNIDLITKSEEYKVFLEEYEKEHKKSFVDNHIGIIRQKVQPDIGTYLREGKVEIFDTVLHNYLIGAMSKSKGTKLHTEYNPVIQSIKKKNNRLMLEYKYENTEHEKKNFIVIFNFKKINDHKNSVHTQTTIGKDLTLKDEGTRGKTESSGKLLNKEALYRQYLKDKKKELKDDTKANIALEKVKQDDTLLVEHFKNKAKKLLNSRGKEEHKILKSNLFDSAHLVADWFGGSGYKEALNLMVTSAEYNRKTMGDAEKSIASRVGRGSLFDLTVSAKWDFLEDKELMDDINANSILSKLKADGTIDVGEEGKKKDLAAQASKELATVLLKNQDPRRVLSVKYYTKMLENTEEKKIQKKRMVQKKSIGCDIWMSSYFDFDKNSDNVCKY